MAQPKMIQIFNFVESSDAVGVTAKFKHEEFQEIINDPRCKDLPFFVLSLTGPKRNGKSFLANLLISKFGYREANRSSKPWLKSEEVVKGVNWRRDRDSVTKGIWIWNHPFIIRTSSRKKVAIVLMDCQGLYDNVRCQATKDAMVTLFSLELSKVQIFNSRGDSNAPDLQHLDAVIAIAKHSKLEGMFNTLIFLHRDCQWAENHGRKGSYFGNKPKGYKLTEPEKAVKSAFEELTEYSLPSPGDNIRKGGITDQRSLKDFQDGSSESANFLEYVDQFGNDLVEVYASQEKHWSSQGQLLATLDRVKRHLQPGEVPLNFPSSAEFLERRRIQNDYEEIEDYVLPDFVKKIKDRKYKSDEKDKMLADLQRAKNGAMEYLAACQEERPARTQMGEEAWRENKEQAELFFSTLEESLLMELIGAAMKANSSNKRSTLVSLAVLGILTGGGAFAAAGSVVAYGAGSLAAVEALGIGAAGGVVAAVGGIEFFFESKNYKALIKEGIRLAMEAKKKKQD